jgi:hypothetical protein
MKAHLPALGKMTFLSFLVACSSWAGADSPRSAKKNISSEEAKHWAFQPVQRPILPSVRNVAWPATPVDPFILARLEAKGIAPAPPADPRTLLRRVFLDLIGLPPTPAEQQAFLDHPSPETYARVVDDLLSRPVYGERWARHWLDVVRYAESNGYERDGAKPSAWRYRDYVIQSFNHDKPYDRFVAEQLAGDELPGSNAETQTATTFLRLGTWDDEPADPVTDRYDQLDDVLGTTATAFLGLTLRCARCHDHKFEPFSQQDYYRTLAVFEPLKRPQKDREDLDRVVGSEAELAGYPVAKTALQEAAAAVQKKITDLVKGKTPEPPRAYVWYEDNPKAPVTHLFRRGDPTRPGKAVEPGVPTILSRQKMDAPHPLAKSTGRRLWLAQWMTRPDNPLLARVMVNRIWQHHFGQGLVASANDFGIMGQPPSHPELLDWLASEFVAGGWSMKALHRLIVLSSTYQMASTGNLYAAQIDPDETLLWRWRPHRLEAEPFRDSVLVVSGQLNPQMRGPSVYPPIPSEVLAGQSRPGDGWGKSEERQASRRSVYIFVKRSLGVPELELLDSPDTTSSCEQRQVSTTGPQALTFLNGTFIHQQARHLAERLEREAPANRPAQVERAFALTLSRPLRDGEMQGALAFLSLQERQIAFDLSQMKKDPKTAGHQALAAFCLVLFNTNEFAYLP